MLMNLILTCLDLIKSREDNSLPPSSDKDLSPYTKFFEKVNTILMKARLYVLVPHTERKQYSAI